MAREKSARSGATSKLVFVAKPVHLLVAVATLLSSSTAFVPATTYLPCKPTTKRTVAVGMSADLFNLQNADAAQLYAASTFAGLATTAMLAPILFTPLVMPFAAGRMKLEEQDDVCEIVNTPPASEMHPV